MASIKSTLRTDLTGAIKGRDELTSATIRMALTAISNEEVSGKAARELSDDEVTVVLSREAKKRREAAEAYDTAGRAQLAARERDELGVLEHYLPAALSDAELHTMVDAAVAQAHADGASGPKAMGAVMKVLSPQTAGRADGGKVAALVRSALSDE
jgi:uncharacterized protein